MSHCDESCDESSFISMCECLNGGVMRYVNTQGLPGSKRTSSACIGGRGREERRRVEGREGREGACVGEVCAVFCRFSCYR